MGPAQRDWGPYKRGRLEADRPREEGREDEGGRLQGRERGRIGPSGNLPRECVRRGLPAPEAPSWSERVVPSWRKHVSPANEPGSTGREEAEACGQGAPSPGVGSHAVSGSVGLSGRLDGVGERKGFIPPFPPRIPQVTPSGSAVFPEVGRREGFGSNRVFTFDTERSSGTR